MNRNIVSCITMMTPGIDRTDIWPHGVEQEEQGIGQQTEPHQHTAVHGQLGLAPQCIRVGQQRHRRRPR